MSWNYRVMAKDGAFGRYFEMHEVYYDKRGEPEAYTLNAVSVVGESPEELIEVLDRMREAIAKPALTSADFPKSNPDAPSG